MSKKSSDQSSKPSKKYSSQTISLAKYGTDLRRLLWQRIIATATTEQRGLLLAYSQLLFDELAIVPYEAGYQVEHFSLLKEIQNVEQLLTGFTSDMLR